MLGDNPWESRPQYEIHRVSACKFSSSQLKAILIYTKLNYINYSSVYKEIILLSSATSYLRLTKMYSYSIYYTLIIILNTVGSMLHKHINM